MVIENISYPTLFSAIPANGTFGDTHRVINESFQTMKRPREEPARDESGSLEKPGDSLENK